jgi:hypothetical protein
MATNKDEFDTTYRKQPRSVISGKDADADTYNIVHADANGHLFTKLVGDAGATNVALACDNDGKLAVNANAGTNLNTSLLSTSANQGKFNGAVSGLSTWKEVDGKPRVSSMPYTYDIAEGNITNHVGWSKIGFNAAVTTEQDIAPYLTAPYVFPTGATTMTIVSSVSNDTKTTGTGAWTVTIYYLTTGFVEKNVTVNMAGTTPVQIATDIFRVQNARVATWSSRVCSW